VNVIFAGTPDFAASALQALVAARHEVVMVLTQPDRPAGRGLKQVASPVKRLAVALGLLVRQPATLKDEAVQSELAHAGADIMVVAAYGLILPQAVLSAAHYGAINIHASLLPRWRGAAPIQRAILAGDRETGVCIMQMEAGLDTGPVLLREAVAIQPNDTAQTLHDRLAALGASLLIDSLARMERGALPAETQPAEGVTYAHKIDKREAQIDWNASAETISRQIRAFDPHPGAGSRLADVDVKVWRAVAESEAAEPGRVLAATHEGIVVGCGQGSLRLLELQRSGGKRLAAAAFLRGFPVAAGTRFD
jgi:methionyl-tRNA formyltransferase